MSHTDPIFALVQDNDILLYPLTYADLNARAAPYEDYYYCYYQPKPVITNNIIEYYEEIPTLVANAVMVETVIRRKSLEDIFTLIGLGPGSTVTIAEVDPAALDAVVILTKERVQGLLDSFAQERGYDDIKSTVTYLNSQVPQYQTEANRAIYLRDLTWSSLYVYLNGIMSGTNPLPASWDDIASNLPALTWS